MIKIKNIYPAICFGETLQTLLLYIQLPVRPVLSINNASCNSKNNTATLYCTGALIASNLPKLNDRAPP
jgi:hypothetical protein